MAEELYDNSTTHGPAGTCGEEMGLRRMHVSDSSPCAACVDCMFWMLFPSLIFSLAIE